MRIATENIAKFPPACPFSRYGHALPWRTASIDLLSGQGAVRQQGAPGGVKLKTQEEPGSIKRG